MITVATFTALINQLLPEPHAGLLAGILFGTKATLSRELVTALTTTGTLHIVALSGMNITILAGLVNMTLLRFINRRVASVVTIALIVGFILFVGPSPSIIRAGIMGGISLLAIVFGRQTWGLLSWILAVSIMLLLNPSWITDLSFQLSALATLGMILFGGKTIEKTNFYWSLIRDDLRLTLAAQVFTIPLIFWYFHRMSLISPLTNILIGWVMQPLTVFGLLAAFAGWIFLPLGQVIAWPAWALLQYVIVAVEWTARVPGASVGW
ncbi:MAG: ComEC/Rec2 family competence protein [Patescibacteria group bacterium]